MRKELAEAIIQLTNEKIRVLSLAIACPSCKYRNTCPTAKWILMNENYGVFGKEIYRDTDSVLVESRRRESEG